MRRNRIPGVASQATCTGDLVACARLATMQSPGPGSKWFGRGGDVPPKAAWGAAIGTAAFSNAI